MKTKIRPFTIVLALLLLISIALNIYAFWNLNSSRSEKTLAGTTYFTDKDPETTWEENDYIAFPTDGKSWDSYRQFGKINSGAYSLLEENIYLITSKSGQTKSYLVHNGDSLYLLQDGKAVKYNKMSNEATYINVKHAEEDE